MPEEFLHYIWTHQLFNNQLLQTTTGEQVEIKSAGQANYDSGPDFFNAKIKLGETTWAGNIEVHKKASDWAIHKHGHDKAYDNVILHVVEIPDKIIKRNDGTEIPTLVLHYPNKLKSNYEELLVSKQWIPCMGKFHKIDLFAFKLGYNRLMIERLEYKTNHIIESLGKNKNNWNETFYQHLASMFGFKVNSVPFELLAKSTPLQVLSKHSSNLFQVEALLFGNAGLLNTQLLGDDYFLEIREEYSFLYKKYKLTPIESHLWKFMRLRPSNFPTIRISQFAALIHNSRSLFSKIIEIESLTQLKKLFSVNASSYWTTHYQFNKPSVKRIKKLGESSINTIIINTIVPFLFVYGESQDKPHLKERAIMFLEELPPEKNSIISKWEMLGVKARSAFETQALLQLKNIYCEKKKCLNCQIGTKIIKDPEELANEPTGK